MTDLLGPLAANLLSPVVLAFALGIVAVLVRSDLKVPEALFESLSIYLLLAIGLKGGVALSVARLDEVLLPALGAIGLGCVIPLWVFAAVRRLVGLGRVDAAAIAAHYGSVSAVTFVAALVFLEGAGIAVEGYVAALVALMEVPGIVVALLLARGERRGSTAESVRELVTSKSVLLLGGGLVVGALSGPERFAPVAPLFVDLFQGVLVLFLLELGLIAGRRLRDVRVVGPRLALVAIGAPVVNGIGGAAVGVATGLSLGGATVLGVLAASASYIAAPAAVRLALPGANPSLYLAAVLAVTFPFNLAVGIPLVLAAARFFSGG
ncbi:MAG: hypothetical protein RL338_462 [Chloroflexota bacterium]|jgi:hypothetical protein